MVRIFHLVLVLFYIYIYIYIYIYSAINFISIYRGVDKSLARPTSRCILFDGENISFDASLVIYINSTNIPPIMIINRIYEHQHLLSLQLVSFLVGLRTYQHPCMPYTGGKLIIEARTRGWLLSQSDWEHRNVSVICERCLCMRSVSTKMIERVFEAIFNNQSERNL